MLDARRIVWSCGSFMIPWTRSKSTPKGLSSFSAVPVACSFIDSLSPLAVRMRSARARRPAVDRLQERRVARGSPAARLDPAGVGLRDRAGADPAGTRVLDVPKRSLPVAGQERGPQWCAPGSDDLDDRHTE